MTAWVVTDGALWAKLSKNRRAEIRTWLRMNGVVPRLVPVDCTVLLAPDDAGYWEIRYEEYRCNDDGRILVDPDNPDEAYVQAVAVPLVIDPPQHWLIPALDTA